MSRATLSDHFHGRESLLAALIERTLEELSATAYGGAAHGDPHAVLEEILDFYCRQQQAIAAPLSECLARQGVTGDVDRVAEALLGQVNGVVFGRLVAGEPLERARLAAVLGDLADRVVAP